MRGNASSVAKRPIWAIIAVLVMVGSAISVFAVTSAVSTGAPASSVTATTSAAPSVLASGTAAAKDTSTATEFGINSGLAARVKATEQEILASGGNLSNFHPPNLHLAPPLTDTHGIIEPLYYVAPAPIGEGYFGLSNTTGTIQATTTNTTSLAGTWQTTDPIGTAAELFDTSSGNAAGEFGAQLNTVLVNVTLDGKTAFGDNTNAPDGCPTTAFWNALPGDVCPNEFWVQNYLEYTESTHALTISNEIWNFSNPTADWAGTGTHTIEGFGSVEDAEVYQGPSSGTITVAPPFTVELYVNYTQGACHADSVKGTGVPSCGTISTTEPNNEMFLNYTVLNSAGTRVCPSSVPTGRVCGEDDDVFFNSVGAANPSGVPAAGPHGRVGSATIQANGTSYNPLGLPNDYEFDYGIGSDDGATNNIVYQDGTVGLYYCKDLGKLGTTNALPSGKCAQYSAPPAASDFGSETGETSTGEAAYWAPASVTTLGNPALDLGPGTPVEHLVTGPSNLVGLWNNTGSPCTGTAPTCPYVGDEPLSYANIAPANAWVGIARDLQPGVEVTNQSYFQIAPTFGFYSHWGGSGGTKTHPTTLGSDLYLPTGWYTIEVLLSGYAPVIQQIDLTGPAAPTIDLTPDFATGAYTPDWAFSNGDLANLSVSPSNTVPNGAGTSGNPYIISAGPPDVGAPFGVPGSVAWVFSNLNDYLFTQWIGAFVNSTTAVTQFNPAPSFPIQYPPWQQPFLGPRFNVPDTDGLQYYFLNAQNIAVIGASDISTWANSEATTLYSFVVNNGANILIADNTFEVSNRGVDFIDGGTSSDSRTINGVVVHGTLAPAINVVWGNTFIPDPQSLQYSGLEPFTAQDALTVAEGYDRVYNNAFDAVGIPTGSTVPTGTVNATANAATADVTFWNATCQAGYHPLQGGVYPSSPACEPLSYSQSLDGYTMTGSILPAATFQGGNYWAGYGTYPDPYANIPYKARLTSVTGTAEIAATTKPYAGDYAPLLDPVYHASFTETGLTSSTTATAFEVGVKNAAGYEILNETATSTTPAGCTGSVCLNFDLPNGAYSYFATTSLSGLAPSPATGTFTVADGSVTPIPIGFSTGYAQTFTESGLHTGVTWFLNVTGQNPRSSATTTNAITLANGVYHYVYSFRDDVGACYVGGQGNLTVSGATSSPAVPFTATNYCVLFAESGLPAGTVWHVTLAGTTKSLSVVSGTSYIGFDEPSGGPYAYSLGSVNHYSESALPSSGSVTVSGASVTETTAAYTAFSVYAEGILDPIDVGQTSDLFAFYSGGTAPYTESWSGLPPGCTSAGVASTGQCAPTSSGTYTVSLAFTDAQGNVATGSFSLIVDPQLLASPSATLDPDQPGGTSTLSANPSGGSGTYDLYAWSGLPAGCAAPGNVESFTCTPTASGAATVSVSVTDSNGGVGTASFSWTIEPSLDAMLSPATATTQPGASVTFTPSTTGGVAPVSGTLQASCPGLSGDVFTPTSGPETCTIYYNATDAVQSTSQAIAVVTVTASLVAFLTPATATTQPGASVAFTPSTTGGVAPVTATLQSSCLGLSGDVFTPASGPEVCTIFYNASDAVGSTSQATATVTVTASLVASLTPGTASIDVGQSVTFSPSTTGGVAPVTATLQSTCPGLSGDVFTPASGPEVCTIFYNASDAVGSTSQATSTVTVDSTVGAGTASATPNPVVIGTATTISTTGATGGTGSYSYAWTGLPSSCASTAASFSCTPTALGDYSVTLTVTDTNGQTASSSFTLDVVPVPEYFVSFSESGLPTGVTWYVNVTGTETAQLSGSGAMLTTDLPAGSYGYAIGSANRDYAAAPGTFNVGTAAVTVDVTFTLQLYTVTVTEVGLPVKVLDKDGWQFGIAAGPHPVLAHPRGDAVATFQEPNGTYPVLFMGPAGYMGSGSWTEKGGGVAVSGPTSWTVTFQKGKTATLSVRAKGLGSGQVGVFEINSFQFDIEPAGLLKIANLTPGTYTYGVVSPTVGQIITGKVGTTAVGPSGNLEIEHSETLVLTFAYDYAVTFTQTGLTGGTWSITVKGVTKTADITTPIVFELTNGTYSYKIGKEAGFKGTGQPTKVTVSGAATSVAVSFVAKGRTLPALLGGPVARGAGPARLTAVQLEALGLLGLLGAAWALYLRGRPREALP